MYQVALVASIAVLTASVPAPGARRGFTATP